MGITANKSVFSLLKKLKNPPEHGDYFRGAAPHSLELPSNLLAFKRTVRENLNAGEQMHRHYRYALVCNLRTGGDVIIDNRIFHLRPGQAILIFPHQFHHYMHVEADSIAWVFITFEMHNSGLLEKIRNVPVNLSNDTRAALQRFLAAYIKDRGVEARDSTRIIYSAGLVLESVIRDGVAEAKRKTEAAYAKKQHPFIDSVNQYIFGSLGSSFSIRDIAKKLSVSESHLRMLYRTKTGMSLGSYIRQMRMSRALGLMRDSAMNFSQIAYECGYDSVYSFSRAFKKTTGLSPRAYRKSRMPA